MTQPWYVNGQAEPCHYTVLDMNERENSVVGPHSTVNLSDLAKVVILNLKQGGHYKMFSFLFFYSNCFYNKSQLTEK